DGSLGRREAGEMDRGAGRAVVARRLRERGGRLLGMGPVAIQPPPADLLRHRAGAVEVDVEARDSGAGVDERARGRGAEAGGAAGHDGGVSFDVHGQFFRGDGRSGFSMSSAMPWPPPMQAEPTPWRSRAGLSARAGVSASRTPVAPKGWPMAMAPPLTLSLASSMPSSRMHAITCAPKASLISKRSMSESL